MSISILRLTLKCSPSIQTALLVFILGGLISPVAHANSPAPVPDLSSAPASQFQPPMQPAFPPQPQPTPTVVSNCNADFQVLVELNGKKIAISKATVETMDLRGLSYEISKKKQAKDLFGLQEEQLDAWLDSQNETKVRELLRKNYKDITFWQQSLYPSVMLKRLAFFNSPLCNELQIKDLNELTTLLRKKRERQIKDVTRNPETVKRFRDRLDSVKKEAGFQKFDIQSSLMQSTALCGAYDLLNLQTCIKALQKIVEQMAPKSIVMQGKKQVVSMLSLIETVVMDPTYEKGMSHVALAIAERMAIPPAERQPANIWNDLVRAFLDAGVPSEKVEDYVWNVLGLFATRGSNIAETLLYFVTNHDSNIPLYFHVLASGVSILDRETPKAEALYSYPPRVLVNIDNGKPYHFWLTAYFARTLGIEFKNAHGAMTAAWLVSMGYQMRSGTAGRDPTRVFQEEVYGISAMKIRLDLALAAAGAVHGALAAKQTRSENKSLDADKAFREMLVRSKPLRPMSQLAAETAWAGTGYEGYSRWKDLVGADHAFSEMKSQGGF